MSEWKKFTSGININDSFYSHQKIDLFSPVNYEDIQVLEFLRLWQDDTEFIKQRTSGTTGTPKEIRISKNAMVFSALNTLNYLKIEKNSNALLCLPVEYIGGKMMIIRALVGSLNLFTAEPTGNPKIEGYYHLSAMTPMQVKNLIDKDISVLNKIENLLLGGGKTSSEIVNALINIDSNVFETYGMTETSSHIALKSLNGKCKSEFFHVMDGIIINTNSENQLIISSKGLDVDNLLTNDIVQIIDGNTFKWIGRKDNVINSGGIKLFPEIIEDKLKEYINSDFFIFGIEDKKFGEICCIAIESKEYNLHDIFVKNLDKFEIPKKIYFQDNFLRTISGKIRRQDTIELILKNT